MANHILGISAYYHDSAAALLREVVDNSAREVIVEFLESGIEPDAVVCISDVMALAALSTFQDVGLRVPQDIAVVGYDDISLAAYSSPALTTVRQNIRHAGRILVESILGLIRGEDVPDTTLSSELVLRKSSGARND